MTDKKKLKGRRIAVLAADGFEKVELSVPVKALRMAGAKVDVISLRRGRIRGMNLHEPASKVRVTKTVQEADMRDYDGSAEAREFVRAFNAAHKPIATLCHGPWLLASAGLLQGKTMTSWPGIRDDVVNAGATWLDQEVVRDGNLVTSRGPQDLAPFVHAITALFSEVAPIPSTASQHAISAPQRDQPPQVVLSAMKWIPRPSFRTVLLGVGAFLGLVAVSRHRAHA
jgi:protease I